MAPKRGGGGGGGSSRGGSSVSSCPGAFSETYQQVQFARNILFFVVFLGIAISLCSFRKKTGAGKKLLGIPYILALTLFILSYGCSIIGVTLLECGTTDVLEYYNWVIAMNVFIFIGYWFLLVVFVWTLNTMLRAQLGHLTSIFKIIYLAIIGVMGVLTCALIGVTSYNNWAVSQRGRGDRNLVLAGARLQVAYYSLYLVSVLASAALALMTIKSLRSRRSPAGDLIGWVIALTISIVGWVILDLVYAAVYLQGDRLKWETSAVLNYIFTFSQALTFIFFICIAKHACWDKPVTDPMAAYGPPPPQQQQYAYNAANGQAYYYQQVPVHNGAGNPAKA